MKAKITALLMFLLMAGFCVAQVPDDKGYQKHRHFVSSSAFMLVNLFPVKDPPRFYQLNYGYRVTPKDAIILEAITWQYFAPLGIPYGSSFEDSDENYPGIVRDYGIGVAYQRFLWRGLYATLHATPIIQQYLTEDKALIQTGL